MDTHNDAELYITRTFAAPRELVWQAWTEPKHIMQWWGPSGFTNTECSTEVRVGGRFRLVMQAPNGDSYPCTGIYREIHAPERIVYDSTADEGHPCGAGLPPRAVVTVSFAEHERHTRLTLHTRFASAARKEAANQAGYSSSWGEALERLAATLLAH